MGNSKRHYGVLISQTHETEKKGERIERSPFLLQAGQAELTEPRLAIRRTSSMTSDENIYQNCQVSCPMGMRGCNRQADINGNHSGTHNCTTHGAYQ
jgi:hypothetical protein